jgi:trigger factor
VAQRISKDVRLAGFRPGRAPINVVITAVGGEQVFNAEVAEELASKLYSQALDESKVEPFGPGQLEDFTLSPGKLVVRVPLEPVVNLKDYAAIRLPAPAVSVADEEIERQIAYLREDHAVVTLVERPAESGDLVEASILGKDGDEEVLRSRRPFVLDDERISLPGLVQAIIGMQAGERKEMTLSVPEDAEDERTRGKELQVTIEVARVNSRVLPEISDELAQAVGQFETLAQLREDIRQRIHEQKQRQADQEYAAQVLDAFTNLSTVAFPPAFVEDRLNAMLAEFKEDVKREERMPYDEWLKVQGKTEAQVRDELRPTAEARGKRGLVMREVARVEGIDVNDAEVIYEIQRQMQSMGNPGADVRKALMAEENLRAVQNNILSNKVLARMMQMARGEAGARAESDAASAEAPLDTAEGTEPPAPNDTENLTSS